MSPTRRVSSFVARRFESLLYSVLPGASFLFTPNSRDASKYADDPPLGEINMKALWVPNADIDEDADEDPTVSVTVTEHWSEEPQVDATEIDGLFRTGYSYHGQIGDQGFRFDYDTTNHPEIPYHLHPLGETDDDVRVETDPVSVDEFLAYMRTKVDELRGDA